MKIVYLNPENTVREIPTDDPNGNIQTMDDIVKYYSEAFATGCIPAPDEVELQWLYDPQSGMFSPPPEPELQAPADPTPDPIAALESLIVDQEYRLTLLELGVSADAI